MDESSTSTHQCPLCDRSLPTKQGRNTHLGLVHSDDAVKAELIDEIDRLATELGHVPSSQEMKVHGAYSSSTYYNYFESYGAACRRAGYDGLQPSSTPGLSRDALLADIHNLTEALGHPPTKREIENHGSYSTFAYVTHFGNTNSAVRAAGYEPYNSWRTDQDSVLYYGPNWHDVRTRILDRDEHSCRACTAPDGVVSPGLHVHHITPARRFRAHDSSVDTDYSALNDPSNLITLCPSCHRHFEGRWQQCSPSTFAANARALLETHHSHNFDATETAVAWSPTVLQSE